MNTCDRCGRPTKYSTCTLCESIEREHQEDVERDEQARAERLALSLEHLNQSKRNAEELLEQSRENAERIADARINPGDYDCPACLYRTLRYRASRCPTCQANVGTEYWDRVDARKKEEAERAAKAAQDKWESEAPARAAAKVAKEKWESEAPARAKALAKTALDAIEKSARQRAVARAFKFLRVYFAYIYPIVVFVTEATMQYSFAYVIEELPKRGLFNMLLLFCPILNWLALLGLMLSGRPSAFEALAICAAAGLVVAFAVGKS